MIQHVLVVVCNTSDIGIDDMGNWFPDHSPQDNSPHGQLAPSKLAPGQLAPGTTRLIDNSPHGQLAPWTTRPMDNSPHRQLAPWTTRPMTTRPTDNSPHGREVCILYILATVSCRPSVHKVLLSCIYCGIILYVMTITKKFRSKEE
jgi:hypothetical protein